MGTKGGNYLSSLKIRQSMDGRARRVDNVRIERWFRSLKCDCVYVNEFNTPRELRQGIRSYVEEYNNERPHEGLDYLYPAQVYKEAEDGLQEPDEAEHCLWLQHDGRDHLQH